MSIIGSLLVSSGAFFTWHFLLTNCQCTKIHCKKYCRTQESLPCLPELLFATVRIQQLINSRTVCVLHRAPRATQPLKNGSLKKKITPKRDKNGWPQLLKHLLRQNDESDREMLGENKKLHGHRSRTSYVRLLGIL